MARILDPRTKIVLLSLGALYIGLPLSLAAETIMMLIFTIPVFVAGLYRLGFLFLLIYSIQVTASMYLLPQISSVFVIYILSFLTNGLRLLMPCIIAGTYALKTTAVSEWIAALKKWHVPNWLLIPIAIIARFFPVIHENYQHIRKAMAFRGIGTNFWGLAKHPVQTLEFILIPLLMNATQISEDLTISALTKGLGLPGRHTSIIDLKMTAYDWGYILLALLPLVLWFGGKPL
jgi:energy-coupling factor transporter transmembrane protein EcfT